LLTFKLVQTTNSEQGIIYKTVVANLRKDEQKMKIFETDRLIIKTIEQKDKEFFIELISDPEIINPIPQPKFSAEEIMDKFNESLNLRGEILDNNKSVWGIFEKGNPDMIGLCLFLTNNENDRELGYRFRVNYWGQGYGTETTKGIINFSFNQLKIDKITADVYTEHRNSVKILEKFMNPVREFFNEKCNCTDRRYEIYKKDWL